MDTPSEYSVGIRLIRRYHPVNIEWAVRLTDGYTEWIFGGYPPNPMDTPSQYWMGCQANRWIHRVNIWWISA